MGWREVEITEEEENSSREAAQCSYPKFTAIGDKHIGKFVEYKLKTGGTYGDEHRWYFTDKEGKRFCITAKFDLHRKLKKAALKPGEIVAMQFASTKDIGQKNPMQMFKVQVADTAPAPPPPPKTDDGW